MLPNFIINFIYCFLFGAGLIVGSFLLNVVLRSEREEEVVKTPSHCPHCQHKLKWFELIPVFSYVFLGGRCSNCKKIISWLHPFVEIMTGLLFVLVFWRFIQFPFFKIALGSGLPAVFLVALITLFLWLVYVSILFLISIYDFRNMMVLETFLYVGLITSFVGEGIVYLINNNFVNNTIKYAYVENYHQFLGTYTMFFNPWFTGIWSNILGAVIAWGVIQLIVTLSKGRAMGDGDPIIAVFIGMILGMSGAMVFIVFSFILGGIYSLILILLRKKTIKQHIAFGPLLALGGMLVFLFGQQILDLYFKFIFN